MARPSTCATRSSTTSTSSATSRRAARSSSRPSRKCPEGALVVLSAHGVAPKVYRKCAERNLEVIDATCPLVSKVHAEARRYAARGLKIALVGHAGHEEVVGTMGEAPDSIVLVETREDAQRARARRRSAARLPDPDDALRRRHGEVSSTPCATGFPISSARLPRTSATRPRTARTR